MKNVRTSWIRSFNELWTTGLALLSIGVGGDLARGAQSVTLAWDTNSETNLAGYNLYWGPGSGSYTNKVNVGKVTTNTVSGLVSGATYYFAATAFNTVGLESDFSNEISYLAPGGSNTPPTISAIANQTILKNTATPAISFTVGDAQTAATNLVLSAVSTNTLLVLSTGLKFGGSGTNRTIIVAPATNQIGTTKITVSVTDGGGIITSQSFALVVLDYNVAPTLNPIGNLTIPEDAGVQVINLSGIGPGASNEVQTLTVTATSGNPGLVPNPVVTYSSPSTTGSLTFSSPTNASGTAVITVVVNDGQSSSNTLARSFTVTVNAVNDPPLLSDIPSQSINKNKTTAAIPFTVQDVETAASNLVVQASSSNPTLMPNAQIVLGGTGTNRTITLSPATNQTGTATITLNLSDGVAVTGKAFVLTVTASNNPPVLTLPLGLAAKQHRSYSIRGVGVSDPDGGITNFNLSLNVGHGTLRVATDVAQGVSAAQVSANNSASVLIVAPLNAIRATLLNTNGLAYTGNLTFTGSDTLAGTLNDNGQTGLGGALSKTAQAVVTVVATSLDSWRSITFSQTDLADPSKEATVWGDAADPDKDGRDNLLEFALGLDPLRSDSNQGAMETGIFQVGGTNYASVVFRRRKNEPMLSYVPEVSADGQVWNPGSNAVKVTSLTSLDSTYEAVVYQDLIPVAPLSSRYFRLRVVKTDL